MGESLVDLMKGPDLHYLRFIKGLKKLKGDVADDTDCGVLSESVNLQFRACLRMAATAYDIYKRNGDKDNMEKTLASYAVALVGLLDDGKGVNYEKALVEGKLLMHREILSDEETARAFELAKKRELIKSRKKMDITTAKEREVYKLM